MRCFFGFLARCPLLVLHGLGVVLGWFVWVVSTTYRGRLLRHARQAGLSTIEALASVGHTGKMVAETPKIWMGRAPFFEWVGGAQIEAAYAKQNGIVFLMPHLGCFEIIGRAWAQQFWPDHGDFTVLYRPARKPLMADLVANSRNRPGLVAVPTTPSGVRQLLKALKQGRAIGVLPDQVPPDGMGVWAPFFGQSAYTMSLAARLAQQSGATVLVGWGERLPWAKGYRIHVEPLLAEGQVLSDDLLAACTQINAAMERAIRQCPRQYLWGYARYKQPRQA